LGNRETAGTVNGVELSHVETKMPSSRDDCEEYLQWCRKQHRKPDAVSYHDFLRERKPELVLAMLRK
jgi:hypothetical protein